jgi:hypothetical protein
MWKLWKQFLNYRKCNNAKSEVRFKQLIRGAFTIDSSTPTLRINLNEHPIQRYTGCSTIREFRIQSVEGKDPVELEKYLEKKFALPEEDISALILFNT